MAEVKDSLILVRQNGLFWRIQYFYRFQCARPTTFWSSCKQLYECTIFLLLLLLFTLAIKNPGDFEKLEENCRSDHYCGQSSNTKESCSSTPLNRCTSRETRWNKKAVSLSSPEWWLIFLARSEKKIRGRLINWAEGLDCNWLKKVICCKTRIMCLLS